MVQHLTTSFKCLHVISYFPFSLRVRWGVVQVNLQKCQSRWWYQVGKLAEQKRAGPKKYKHGFFRKQFLSRSNKNRCRKRYFSWKIPQKTIKDCHYPQDTQNVLKVQIQGSYPTPLYNHEQDDYSFWPSFHSFIRVGRIYGQRIGVRV